MAIRPTDDTAMAGRSGAAADLDAAGALDLLAGARVALARLGGMLHQLGSDGLGSALEELRRVAALADAASVGVVAEATERGVPGADGSQAGSAARSWTREWVARHAPGTDPATISRLVTLGTTAGQPCRAVLTDAVLAGQVGLVTAAVALREFDRLEPDLCDAVKDDVLAAYVQLGSDNDPAAVRQVRPQLIARFGGERRLEHTVDRLRDQRHLSGPVSYDQMTQYTLTLDPEAAARLEAGLDLLSAPAPTEGEPDLRSAGQRRADALMALVARAVAAGGAAPAQAKAQLVITIPIADLRSGVRGCGLTLGRAHQATLDPETVRKTGCDATVMLLALGAKNEPLALGRTRRLVTPGMLKALWVRDTGCTYPGCHAPPAWSDAHHVRHWADGGKTDLNNLTLLCGRHHTKVHQTGATATITHGRVHWQL